MRILAIDVGIQVCGYVMCEVNNLDVSLLKEDEIKPSRGNSLPQKLNHIFDELEKEIRQYNPGAVAVEKLYSHYRHPTTLGVLAQVRGVVTLLAYRRNLDFFEYSPTRARKSFMGKGNASSEQVKKMAENLTGKKFMSEHTADAYSLVVAFSHSEKYRKILKNYYDCPNKRENY